jgi:hypothetical protein
MDSFSLYLVRTHDLDLAFKIMLCCLLVNRFQLNQKAERCRVRKKWPGQKGQDAGQGWRTEEGGARTKAMGLGG